MKRLIPLFFLCLCGCRMQPQIQLLLIPGKVVAWKGPTTFGHGVSVPRIEGFQSALLVRDKDGKLWMHYYRERLPAALESFQGHYLAAIEWKGAGTIITTPTKPLSL